MAKKVHTYLQTLNNENINNTTPPPPQNPFDDDLGSTTGETLVVEYIVAEQTEPADDGTEENQKVASNSQESLQTIEVGPRILGPESLD